MCNMTDRTRSSGQPTRNKRLYVIIVLLVAGLVVDELAFLASSWGKLGLLGLSLDWAWAYIAFIWGAAFVLFLIPIGLSKILPAVLMAKRGFDRFCRAAFLPHDYSSKGIAAQLLVSSLLNSLVLDIAFLPALAASIVPALGIFQLSYRVFLNSYWFTVFMWLFAGIMGPAVVYAVRFNQGRKFLFETESAISSVRRTCHLAIFVGGLVIISSFLGAGVVDQSATRFFFFQYVDLVIPSTFVGTAVMNSFESKILRLQAKDVLGTGALLFLSWMLIFHEITWLSLGILTASVLIWLGTSLVLRAHSGK